MHPLPLQRVYCAGRLLQEDNAMRSSAPRGCFPIHHDPSKPPTPKHTHQQQQGSLHHQQHMSQEFPFHGMNANSSRPKVAVTMSSAPAPSARPGSRAKSVSPGSPCWERAVARAAEAHSACMLPWQQVGSGADGAGSCCHCCSGSSCGRSAWFPCAHVEGPPGPSPQRC